tara:strand:+ start:39 stop:254 length:216 start_codon:yes stop_codon:yes gene_type:complete
MQILPQDQIIATLEEKINLLKTVLEETIVKHSDAEYDLKDLKLVLEDLSVDKFNCSPEKMLVMANEWEDVK